MPYYSVPSNRLPRIRERPARKVRSHSLTCCVSLWAIFNVYQFLYWTSLFCVGVFVTNYVSANKAEFQRAVEKDGITFEEVRSKMISAMIVCGVTVAARLVSIGSLVAIYFWKKWGWYAYAITVVLLLCTDVWGGGEYIWIVGELLSLVFLAGCLFIIKP